MFRRLPKVLGAKSHAIEMLGRFALAMGVAVGKDMGAVMRDNQTRLALRVSGQAGVAAFDHGVATDLRFDRLTDVEFWRC